MLALVDGTTDTEIFFTPEGTSHVYFFPETVSLPIVSEVSRLTTFKLTEPQFSSVHSAVNVSSTKYIFNPAISLPTDMLLSTISVSFVLAVDIWITAFTSSTVSLSMCTVHSPAFAFLTVQVICVSSIALHCVSFPFGSFTVAVYSPGVSTSISNLHAS